MSFEILLSFAPSPVLSKSRRPISDSEIRQKKNECYADIESQLCGNAIGILNLRFFSI
ncbi:hypothetical protein AAG906_018631 [Vitis piasezkii]